MAFREHIAIVSEGSGSRPSKSVNDSKKKSKGTQGKRGKGTGGSSTTKQVGRPKSSAGAMSHILFRGSVGGVEGRLPGEVRYESSAALGRTNISIAALFIDLDFARDGAICVLMYAASYISVEPYNHLPFCILITDRVICAEGVHLFGTVARSRPGEGGCRGRVRASGIGNLCRGSAFALHGDFPGAVQLRCR